MKTHSLRVAIGIREDSLVPVASGEIGPTEGDCRTATVHRRRGCCASDKGIMIVIGNSDDSRAIKVRRGDAASVVRSAERDGHARRKAMQGMSYFYSGRSLRDFVRVNIEGSLHSKRALDRAGHDRRTREATDKDLEPMPANDSADVGAQEHS